MLEIERIAASSLAAGLLSLILLACRRTRGLALALASVGIGAALGFAQACAIHDAAEKLSDTPSMPVEMKLLEDSKASAFGEIALVEATFNGYAPVVATARFGNGDGMLCGEIVSGEGTFSPANYAKDSYAWREGSCGNITVNEATLHDRGFPLSELIALRKAAIERIGARDERHALLQALVCGYRRNIAGSELYAGFQTCGLAHLVAVSGAHLVIVTGLFATLLQALRAPKPLVVFLLVAIMGSYYIVSGMPVSALRAAIMSALGLFSFFGKRRPSSLNAVGLAAFAIIGASPQASVSASFALSALSTTGIVLFAPLISAWIERMPVPCPRIVADAASLTASASILSQLYACSLFSQLPLVAPVANVLCAPLFPVACGLGLVSGLAQTALGQIAALDFISGLAAGALVGSVELLADIPFSSVPFSVSTSTALAVSALLGAIAWAWWPAPKRGVIAVFACAAAISVLALASPPLASDAIVALDVGQGDAILVLSRGHSLLIDTGNQDARLLEQLAQMHAYHLDAVLLTHADDDHFGSLDALAKAVNVDHALFAEGMLTCSDSSARKLVDQAGKTATDVIGIEAGDRIDVGAFNLRVIWPQAFSDGGNPDSVCLVAEYDGDGDGTPEFRALLTGDAEKEQLATMIDEHLVGDIDLLKVGHHGSRNGSTASELSALKPEIALISCGAHNRYGHPAPETLSQLADIGAATFRTDTNGRITCSFSTDRITVSTEKEG